MSTLQSIYNLFRPISRRELDLFMNNPRLSCVVKGLIHSAKETPQNWADVGLMHSWWSPQPETSKEDRVLIDPDTGCLNDYHLFFETTFYERAFLCAAMNLFVIPYHKSVERDEQEMIKERFAHLGCPNRNSPYPTPRS